MWERLSLRTRLLLPLGLMFVAALLAGGVSLQIFATAQLMEETEPTARSARAVAAALNGALQASTNPPSGFDASGPTSMFILPKCRPRWERCLTGSSASSSYPNSKPPSP
jgi:hypothetical protein